MSFLCARAALCSGAGHRGPALWRAQRTIVVATTCDGSSLGRRQAGAACRASRKLAHSSLSKDFGEARRSRASGSVQRALRQQQVLHAGGAARFCSSAKAAGAAPHSPALPEHLQRVIDEYDRRQAEEERAGLLPEVFRSRYGGIIGMCLAGIGAYVIYCFDDVSSEVHSVTGWILGRLDPETARAVLLRSAAWGLLPSDYDKDDPYLVAERLEGMKLVIPIGVSAGLDREAVAPNSFLNLGFGFVEVGPVAAADAKAVGARLAARDVSGILAHLGKVGAAITGDREELLGSLPLVGPHVDFLSVEVLGCNGDGDKLQRIVADVVDAAALLPAGGPKLFLRIPPAQPEVMASTVARKAAAAHMAAAARWGGADGVVLCAAGGDAGTESPLPGVVAEVYRQTEGKLMLIVSGGVRSGIDALYCMEAGASAVQISSPLLSEGPQVCRRLKNELSSLLMNEGYVNLEDAVGSSHRKRRKGKVRARNPWAKTGASA